MPPIVTVYDVLLDKLSHLQSAEMQIGDVLLAALDKISDSSLQKTIQDFQKHTFRRISDLGKINGLMQTPIQDHPSPAVKGIKEEIQAFFQQLTPSPELDVSIIASIQNMLNYINTEYGYAANFAYQATLNMQVQKYLNSALKETLQFNQMLSEIAEQKLNQTQKRATATKPPQPKDQPPPPNPDSPKEKIKQKTKEALKSLADQL